MLGSSSNRSFTPTKDSFFNFQLNAVGIRVGKTLASFIEFGFGYKGLINLGVSAQF